MSGTTRDKLLAAAEKLLVEEGVHALTVRRVGEVSGLNPTLITYHFGSVSGLLQDLLQCNLAPMLEAWEWLSGAEAGQAEVAAVLTRWLAPLHAPAAFHATGRALIVLDEIAAHGNRALSEDLVVRMTGIATRVAGILAPRLPHLSREELRERLRLIAGAALGPPPRARLTAPGDTAAAREEAVRQLVRFASAALSTA